MLKRFTSTPLESGLTMNRCAVAGEPAWNGASRLIASILPSAEASANGSPEICAPFALARYWRKVSVYDALLAQDGIYLPHGSNRAGPGGDATDIAEKLAAGATWDATA